MVLDSLQFNSTEIDAFNMFYFVLFTFDVQNISATHFKVRTIKPLKDLVFLHVDIESFMLLTFSGMFFFIEIKESTKKMNDVELKVLASLLVMHHHLHFRLMFLVFFV